MASILLGVTGGIAAYKACALTSRLVQRGDTVDVILTEEAARFVTPLSFAALTRRTVWTSLWENQQEIPHITLVRAAEVFVIAPATANTIAKLALGLADNLLTNAALAARIPLIVAPAMNSAMYDHPATQGHLEVLRSRGVSIVEPEDGFLAERESGVGRLASEERLLAAIDRVTGFGGPLAGKRVLITAGPTREAIDPVRFLSNASSGATGIALAEEARRRGASVRLVLGPTHLDAPRGVQVSRVTTAAEMLNEALEHDGPPDLIIATAAVADERPVHPSDYKMKKRDGGLRNVELAPTEDVVGRLRDCFPRAAIVGFAAETHEHTYHAREKLEKKRLDAVVLNDVSAGRAFGAQKNAWTVLTKSESVELPRANKNDLARSLLDTLFTLIPHLAHNGNPDREGRQ